MVPGVTDVLCFRVERRRDTRQLALGHRLALRIAFKLGSDVREGVAEPCKGGDSNES